MTFQKFKSDSYCLGGRHRSSMKNNYGDITSKGSRVIIGYCSICNRKKSMTVSDNTIQAEGFFSKILVKKDLMYRKRWQEMYSKILAELLISQQILLQQQKS